MLLKHRKLSRCHRLLIPAYKPPHKSYNQAFSQHRLNMVKLAIEEENNPKIELSDIEFKREEKSYTYITICELRKIYNLNNRINFIIGTDAFERIEQWYEIDKLKKLVRFILFKRAVDANFDKFEYLKAKGFEFVADELPFEDISSTHLRNMIKNNENYDKLISVSVKEYIEENELYKN